MRRVSKRDVRSERAKSRQSYKIILIAAAWLAEEMHEDFSSERISFSLILSAITQLTTTYPRPGFVFPRSLLNRLEKQRMIKISSTSRDHDVR